MTVPKLQRVTPPPEPMAWQDRGNCRGVDPDLFFPTKNRTAHDLAWRELGNCVGVDPDLFFGGRGDNKSHAAAKRVCAGCEVRDECLAYALDNNERFGVWGGLSERQRHALRRAVRR